MSIPEQYVISVVEKIDLLGLVQTTVDLKKHGANWFGLCPFHKERSPSFSVRPSKGFYHCFGCGAHGDAIDWATKIQGMSFRDAVYEFSRRMGMRVPEDNFKTEAEKLRSREEFRLSQTIAELNEKVAKVYHERLRTDKTGSDYARTRSLSGEAAKYFMLGYAPEEWRFLASQVPDYGSQAMLTGDLVSVRDGATASDKHEEKFFDRFRGRLMFPIRSVRGQVVGFGGRTVSTGTPKYLNTSETPCFVKGRELYGLYEARNTLMEASCAIVVEGYMDVVAMWMFGIHNAVASLGTACTKEQMQKLFRYIDRVVFCFDGDDAGAKAAVRALEVTMEFVNDQRTVGFVSLPEGEDPDTFLQAHGRPAFDALVATAKPLSRMAVDVAMEDCDMNVPEGRGKMLKRAFDLWKKLPASGFRLQMIEEFAKAGQIDRNILADEWKGMAQAEQEKEDFKREQEAGNQGPYAAPVGGQGSKFIAMPPRPGMSGTPSAPGTPGAARPGWIKEGGRFRPLKPWEVGARSMDSMAVAELASGARGGRCGRDALVVGGFFKRMEWLAELAHEDIESLCALPGEVGRGFTWLDSTLQDEGTLEWATIKVGLAEREFGARVLAMVAEFEADQVVIEASMEEQRIKDMLHRAVYQIKGQWLEGRIRAAMAANPAEYPEAKEELAELMRSKQAHAKAGQKMRHASQAG